MCIKIDPSMFLYYSTEYRVEYRVQSTEFRVQSTEYRVQSTEYRVQYLVDSPLVYEVEYRWGTGS